MQTSNNLFFYPQQIKGVDSTLTFNHIQTALNQQK